MPFTFSHPAIVLLFKRINPRWISITGLVLGSMVPDFEYFLRMNMRSEYSHTLGGVFLFDLPLCIILSFIFHNIIRNSLIQNLPKFLKARFASYKPFCWNTYFRKNWIIVIVSVLIGVFSHVLWDAFTHWNGYFVQNSLFFNKAVFIFGYSFPMFKILQHASSLLGGIILATVIMIHPKKEMKSERINIYYWVVFVIATFIVVFIKILMGLDYRLYGNLIVTIISAGLLSLIFTSLVWKRKKR